MHRYEVFKVFKLGKKAGKRSNHPLCEIDAKSLDEATESFKASPKWKSDMEFHVILKADVIVQKQEVSNPSSTWKIGDKPWFQMHPSEEDAPFVQGEIKKIQEQNGKNIYVIWVLGDYASWRYKTDDGFQRQPPKRKKLPAITEEESEILDA